MGVILSHQCRPKRRAAQPAARPLAAHFLLTRGAQTATSGASFQSHDHTVQDPVPDLTLITLAIALGALLLGGFAKGVLGVGLPMVAIPILSTFLPIRDVVAILFFPILATNLWQALYGGYLTATLKRFWPMLLIMTATIWLGTFSLTRLDASIVTVLLGIFVAIFALASLARPQFRIAPNWELGLSLLAGAIGGFFGGMALIGGPPVIMLMVALHLKKEEFIGAMGLLYLAMLPPAAFSLISLDVLQMRHVVPGLATLVPVLAGLAFGQWVRGRIDQERFRKILLVSMVLIGLNLIRRGLF
jgi:uncharacterized membrane protein YfcA